MCAPIILPYIYNSNKLGTKTVVPRGNTAPHGVETSTSDSECQRHAEMKNPIPGAQILSYIYNSNKPGTKTVVRPSRCGKPKPIG